MVSFRSQVSVLIALFPMNVQVCNPNEGDPKHCLSILVTYLKGTKHMVMLMCGASYSDYRYGC